MELIERIGGGSYGSVYKAKRRDDDRIVACKSIRLYSGLEYLTEATIMACLDHPHINRAISIRMDDCHLYIVQELAECDLFEWILENELDEETLDQWFFQLLNAVLCLHKEGFVHCDIKPSNILVVNGQLRIADFTLTMRKEWAQYFEHSICSANYRPIEVWQGVAWNEKVDIWGLGCLFYFMKHRCNIFSNQSDSEIGKHKIPWMLALKHWEDIYNGRRTVSDPVEYYPPILIRGFNKSKKHDSIIWKMLNPVAKYRWSAERILQKYYSGRTIKYSVAMMNRDDDAEDEDGEGGGSNRYIQIIKQNSPNKSVAKLAINIYELIDDSIERNIRIEVALRLSCKFIFLKGDIQPSSYRGELPLEEIAEYEKQICSQLKFIFPIFNKRKDD